MHSQNKLLRRSVSADRLLSQAWSRSQPVAKAGSSLGLGLRMWLGPTATRQEMTERQKSLAETPYGHCATSEAQFGYFRVRGCQPRDSRPNDDQSSPTRVLRCSDWSIWVAIPWQPLKPRCTTALPAEMQIRSSKLNTQRYRSTLRLDVLMAPRISHALR